jgi:hypothetical protein
MSDSTRWHDYDIDKAQRVLRWSSVGTTANFAALGVKI